MPELPGLAETVHKLLWRSSVVPGRNITLAGIGSVALQQACLPSLLTVTSKEKTEQQAACFSFLLRKNQPKAKDQLHL